MNIRHADAQRDGPACAAIYAPFVHSSAVSFEEKPPDGEEFARRMARIGERYPYLVAEEEGAVAGYAYGTEHRARRAYRWTVEVAIYLGEDHRGRGIGRALYAALLDLLARQGLRTAVAGITLPNPASVALHEACGFEPVGVYRRVGFKQGRWCDVGWWQLDLAPGADAAPAEPGPPPRLEDGA